MSTVMDRYSARHVLDRAITSALTERRPAVVIVPEDLQEEEYSGPSRIHGDTYTSVGWSQPAWSPTKRFSGRPRDVLFMIGTSFPSAEWLPREGQARCVEIDVHGSLVGARYPNDVSLVGHANDTLEALIPLLERKKDRSWRSTIEKEIVSWDRVLDDNAHEKGDPVNPQYIFWELNKRLPKRDLYFRLRICDQLVRALRDVAPPGSARSTRTAPCSSNSSPTRRSRRLPPHVSPQMLRKTLKAFAQVDETARGIAVKGFRGK